MENLILFIVMIAFSGCKKTDVDKDQTISSSEELKEKDVERSECPPSLLYNVDELNGFRLYVSKTVKANFEKKATDDFIKFHKTENSDSLEKALQIRFPNIFKKNNNRYTFTTKMGKREISVMNHISSEDKSSGTYMFLGSYKDLVLLHQQYYEGQDYLVINTTNAEVFAFANEPRFMSEHRLLSLGENYGTVDLQIFDLKEKRNVIVNFESWRQGFILREHYPASQDNVYMKLEHSKNASFYEFQVQANSH